MVKPDKRKKFVELAEKRVNKTLNDIRLIGNLSNRTNYAYEHEDIRKIYRALKSAIDEMKGRFDNDGSSGRDTFRL